MDGLQFEPDYDGDDSELQTRNSSRRGSFLQRFLPQKRGRSSTRGPSSRKSSASRHKQQNRNQQQINNETSQSIDQSAINTPTSQSPLFPRFNRLAASLRLPHYYKSERFNDENEEEETMQERGRLPGRNTDSLPRPMSYRVRKASREEPVFIQHKQEERVVDYEQQLRAFTEQSDNLCAALHSTVKELNQSGAVDYRLRALQATDNELQTEHVQARLIQDHIINGNKQTLQLLDDSEPYDMTLFGWRRASSSSSLASVDKYNTHVSRYPAGESDTLPHQGAKYRQKSVDPGGHHGLNVRKMMRTASMETFTERPPSSLGYHSGQSVGTAPSGGQAQGHAVRTYLKEARVKLLSGLQSQDRYLFLFNDLLLIAKEKAANSYKLKDKVRVCECWVRVTGMEEVTDAPINDSCSFIIGWPTNNFVLEFGTPEEKNNWLHLLQEEIEAQRSIETPAATTVTIHYKPIKAQPTQKRVVPINNLQNARDLVRIAVSEYDLNLEDPYQIWVHSHKENAPYPLFGYESPFAILLSHVRDIYPTEDNDTLTAQQMENLAHVSPIMQKCRFVLRPRSQSAAPTSRRSNGAPRSRKAAAGNIMSQLKRKVLNRSDSAGDTLAQPTNSAPTGSVFAHPLHSLTNDNSVPKPIMDLLVHLFNDGCFVEGIFRKPPKQSSVRMLKQRIDSGELVKYDEEQSPLVTASLLKDFLRNLPNKLLVNDLYYDWMATVEETDVTKKITMTRRLVGQLPPANYQLLRHVLCVLHHISVHQSLNQMSTSNLSVCIAQSLLEKPNAPHDVQDSVKRIPQLVEFMIDHVVDLFGSDTLTLFGSVPEQKTVLPAIARLDSGEESDSIGTQMRIECNSSIDSFAVSGSGSSPPLTTSRPQSQSSSLLARHPANESRDSGLSEVHYLTDDSAGRSLRVDVRSAASHRTPLTSTQSSAPMPRMSPAPHHISIRPLEPESVGANWRTGKQSVDHAQFEAPDTTTTNNDPNHPNSLSKQPLRNSRRIAAGTLQRSDSGQLLLVDEPEEDKVEQKTRLDTSSVGQQRMQLSLPSLHQPALKSQGAESPDSCLPDRSPDPPSMTRDSLYRRPARNRATSRQALNGQSSLSPSDGSDHEDTQHNATHDGTTLMCNTDFATDQQHKLAQQYHHAHLSQPSSSGNSSLSSLASDSDNLSQASPTPQRNTSLSHKGSKLTRSDRVAATSPAVLKYRVTDNGAREQSPDQRTHAIHHKATASMDSSTVTESDDDSATPVVSRESSRAHELQSRAREMFAQQALDRRHARQGSADLNIHRAQQQPDRMETESPPRKATGDTSYSAYHSSARALYSWEASAPPNRQTGVASCFVNRSPIKTSVMPAVNRPVAQVQPAVIRQSNSNVGSPSLSSRANRSGGHESPSKHHKDGGLPPSYEDAIRRRSSLRGEQDAADILAAKEHLTTVLSKHVAQGQQSQNSNSKPPKPVHLPISSNPTTVTSATNPPPRPIRSGQFRRQERYDRENVRRKTLGGDEYQLIAELSKQQRLRQSVDQPSHESYSSASPSRPEINWSVSQLRSKFDDGRSRSGTTDSSPGSSIQSPSSTRLPWSRDPNLTSNSTKRNWAIIRPSEQQATYPVIKPPPLKHQHSLQSPGSPRQPLRMAATKQYSSGYSQEQRTLMPASRQLVKTSESYV